MDLTTVFSSLMSGCIARPIGVNLRRNLRLFSYFFLRFDLWRDALPTYGRATSIDASVAELSYVEPWRLTTTLPHDRRHVTGWAPGSDTPPHDLAVLCLVAISVVSFQCRRCVKARSQCSFCTAIKHARLGFQCMLVNDSLSRAQVVYLLNPNPAERFGRPTCVSNVTTRSSSRNTGTSYMTTSLISRCDIQPAPLPS